MTKDKALYAWFNEFMTLYPDTNVPGDVVFPYGTYTLSTAAFGDDPVSLTVQMWFRTESEAIPNQKVQELSERIGRGGVVVPCYGGAIWLTRGSPFSISAADATDSAVKLRQINITAEYFTQN